MKQDRKPSDRGRSGSRRLRARLLAGVATLACGPLLLSGQALAQDAPPVEAADGLPSDAVYMDAGSVSRDGDILTAEGTTGGDRVFARFRGHTMQARSLSYDLADQTAAAEGDVELMAPDGTVVFASLLELEDDLQTGVAVDFATRLDNGASLMAASAVRRSDTLNELNYALFTPCPICDEQGRPKTPSISIQAERVVQDEALRAILYRNAIFRIGGVPVLYLPVFGHPDPTVERASGLLVPVVEFDQERGLSYEQPYLVVVSPSEDWLISPQLNTEVAPLLNLQWRRRFADGTVVVRGGYTHERTFGDFDIDDDGIDDVVTPLDREHRSYLLAHGRFDPEGPWRYGFTLERTSDKTLFDRYDIRNPYQDNGLYYGDERRLISQIYAEHQTRRSYVSVAAFDIQSLRVAIPNEAAPGLNVFEADSSLPVVAPLITARWEPAGPVLGGRLRLSGSSVALFRDDFVGTPVLSPVVQPDPVPPGLSGVDSRRITGRLDWRRSMVSRAGVIWEPFIDGRVDLYSLDDLPPPFDTGAETVSRSRLTAGLDIRYPLIRSFAGSGDLIVEPRAQLSVSTASDLDPRIPNEDSQTLELDEASLFHIDRYPGHDLYEGGTRLTLGTRATWRWDTEREVSVFLGRSWRDDEEPGLLALVPNPDPLAPPAYYDPGGLASSSSDWVVQGTFSPTDGVRGWAHATLDDSGDIRRAEVAVEASWRRRDRASITWLVDRSNPVAGPLNRNYEFVELTGQQFIWGNWGLAGTGVLDIERDLITRSEVGLLFDDDCFRFELGFRRDNTRVRPSGPSEGVYIRLNLATFGGSGYDRSERRW